MSQCKKFAPNIFNKTKCSNCFRQKEEHSAVALECNRASRTSARSGYLFLAPDWDFSVPLNRTKRWQRRWFVLYDDGELSYSVDEHPDTIPQGTVDMSQVLEVTSAEQLTGHPHSLALTAPDRVTFVKAASREDARWWLELLAVFPRRHKRNATFPGGRASPSLPHLGRSASPQPPRPLRHHGGGDVGGSPRTNFTTPPLKEERDRNTPAAANSLISLSSPSTLSSSNIQNVTLTTSGSSSSVGSNTSPRCSLVGVILKGDAQATAAAKVVGLGVDMVDHQQSNGGGRPQWVPESSAVMSIDASGGGGGGGGARDALLANPRTEYLISSGSPPTRDKLRCEDKARARRDWRHERLRDIATALTDRSPESSLTLPAEGLLHLKKGWLWHREAASSDSCDEWRRRWWVLCGPSLLGYRDQDEEAGGAPLVSVELATVTGYSELRTDTRFGFQVLWSGGPPLTLCAVTMGIRSNWLQALRKAAPGIIESPSPMDAPPATTTSSNSSVPSSTSSSRHSTASSSQLTAVITAQQTPAQSAHGAIITHESGIRLRGDTLNSGVSCRLSTGSSSGGATPTTPKSGTMFSSDEEYRTASEGGRRDSMTDVDWVDSAGGGGGSMVKNLLNRSKDQRIERSRPQRLPRCQSSRQSTLDSNISSPDELDAASLPYTDRIQCQPITMGDTRPTSPVARMYYRHSVADMRTRKLHLQLQLDEEEAERRRKRADGEMALEKELEAARGDVRALEEEAQRLRGLLGEAASKELKSRDAVYDLEKIERDLTLKLEKLLREQKSLNRRLSESDEAIRESDERSATLNRELQAKQRVVASLQDELTCANERCAASRLENDRLYKKLQELNTHNPPTATITPPPHPTTTTISHLTNIDLDSPLTSLSSTALTHHCLDLRMRFERTVAEIRELQHRLREAHAQVDVLQLDRLRFGQRVDAARAEYEGRVGMLKERVDDLTAKLLQVERVKSRGGGGGGGGRGQSTASGSGKVGRRSLSLRGRESFSLNKEVEDKVTLLEAKLLSLENPNSASAVDRGRSTRRGKYSSTSGRRSTDNGSPIDDRSLRRLRRKSLDGATASEPMKLLMRLNALEEKVSGGGRRTSIESLNGVSASDGGAAVDRVDDSEMEALSLAREKYLQCVTTLGTAPGNIPVVLDGHMRELGRILRVPDDSLAINSDVDLVTASAQSLVGQLERALRRHYTELHERRSRLRERGELDYRAKVELLAEKIAFEDVIIGRIAEVLPSTNKLATTFLARETLETHHLIHHLRAKLNPSTTPTHSTHLHTSIQHLTQRFARQLLANAHISHRQQQPVASPRRGEEVRACADRIDAAGWRLLLGEQSRVHEMLDRYQRVRLVELADRLAADTVTLAADRSCSLVEEVGGRVWDEARRRVSAELIQSEVRHVLMKTAQQYEDLNSSDHTAGYSFTIFAMQRSKIEQWTDSIEEHLLARMEHFISHLTATYHTSLHRMSTSNPPEQPTPNSSTSLLHEYADIIAHVALVDARIATLQSKSAVSGGKSAVSGGISGGADETVGLRALLEASGGTSFGDINEVSVAEFKAALEVAVLCADRCVANISAGIEGGGRAAVEVSCAKCREGRNIAAVGGSVDIYGDVCNGSFNWIGTSFNSYDSLSDQTPPPLQKLTSVSPTFPFSPSPPTTTTTYHHQIALLRDAFQQTLATYSDTSTDNQPSTREHQRHLHLVESSVERLRVVCEQVLVAMERVHRAAVQRMRANHQLEIDAVRRDKEQALAEETHATLAALDAMRKAHEAEVVKEVARFKQELSRQQAAELLELRERLSVKCLEVAALQEQLGSATRQLAHAHQHILHLEQQRAPTAS